MNVNLPTGTVIPSIFGDGIFGRGVTGLLRIPAFMSNAITIMMVGELAMKGLSSGFESIGFKPAEDSWVQKGAKAITQYGVRPYKDLPLQVLLVRIVAFWALGVLGSEFVRILGGTAPGIYNDVLRLLGPLRIDSQPYLVGVRATGALLGIK